MKPARNVRRFIESVMRQALRGVAAGVSTLRPQHRSEGTVTREQFGAGCAHDWPWYFHGRSTVRARSTEEACTWLLGCSCVTDRAPSDGGDFWQHPVTFETTRRGSSADHALWAWRKLSELGIPAELVVGRATHPRASHNPLYAWVIFHRKRRVYLLDASAKSGPAGMIRPAHRVRNLYHPHVSVDADFKTYSYVDPHHEPDCGPAPLTQESANSPGEAPGAITEKLP